ncbi:uncharacterized protein JN550_000576 [Neoarthrinium moseri]|uniref:uncharacterized protein n=1 Tax=Neoarthrinium moseri TaxID=1658444 RepID=UPI001FDB9390|nr:uncharacterized protein JN550_000576 [Neoarthrinium moseri]KAI1878394.1 hypothetical protein JN550_000576 [Neoarthrinium moseri]
MPKRKAAEVPEQDLRRSTRRRSAVVPEPTATKRAAAEPEEKKPAKSRKVATADGSKSKVTAPKAKATAKAKKETTSTDKPAEKPSASAKPDTNGGDASSGKSYWLLKAEPETRLENGVDVRFSIDDLAAKTQPEPWDGIRNYVARNNLRAMKKGDLAFFYHSNCKEPGIVGTMEIVQEHSPDLSAHDPKAPYYDASSKPADPKWSVVHVEFRSKFAEKIGLKDLREMGKMGAPLENMQLLKQSRLSVSRVSPAEWEHLMGVARENGGISKEA